MKLEEIHRLSGQKRGIPNRIYIDEYNNKYRGTKDGRIVQIYSTELVVKNATSIVENESDNDQNKSTKVDLTNLKNDSVEGITSSNLDFLLMLISLKI